MNILFLAHRIPYPPDKGDKLRSFHQLEYLSRHHRVWCACFVDSVQELGHARGLGHYCEDVAVIRLRRSTATLRGLWGLLCGGTVTESFYHHAAMIRTLRSWCRRTRFDVVIAFSSSMAPYALNVPARRRIVDLCDLDSRKWLDYASVSRLPTRWLYRVEGKRLGQREREWVDAFDASLLISAVEAAPLKGVVDPSKLHIVTNGVNLPDECRLSEEVFTESPFGLRKDNTPTRIGKGGECASKGPREATIGFVGVMNYRPNVEAVRWFVSTCWHDIRAACPQAVFRIVGRSPARAVRSLATVPGVKVVGEVGDVMAEVRRFTIGVAPMRHAYGLQNKVLECMAAARPVVLSKKAAEGIAARDGHHFLVANGEEDFSYNVIQLLRNPKRRRQLGMNARLFVARHHRWEDVLRTFELVVTGAIERSRPFIVPQTRHSHARPSDSSPPHCDPVELRDRS